MTEEAGLRHAGAASAAQAGRALSRRHVLAALFACAALAAAVGGRLSACAGCEHEVAGVPLFLAGSLFYLALGLAALFGMSLVRLGWISLPGLAIQAGLTRYLLVLGAACWTCLAAAALLFALSLVCLLPDRRWRFAPPLVAAAGFLALPVWSGLLVEMESVGTLPEFARKSDLHPPAEGAVLLVVYEKAGCPYCGLFDRDYEPRLAREFAGRLVVQRIHATDRGGLKRVPSFLIRGRDGSLLVVRGLPPYRDLASLVAR
ncbi:MAG TPA: hypothetical protein VGK61_06565 [Planctomycetota bacterium]